MYKILHVLAGEYVIGIEGEAILPFLYALAEKGIRFWNLVQTENGWELRTSLSQAENLLSVAEEYGIRAERLKEHGLPFLFARYKKRPGLVLGMLLGLALIFYSELFVWKVTVNGNKTLSDREIIRALEDYGIGVGSYIPKIPVLQAQNDFLLTFADLSSIAINVKGTHIEVELLERTHAPEIVDTSGFCNVIASESGLMVYTEVDAGTGRVLPGDTVEKGQLLISAFTVNERNVFRMEHARGKMIAHTYETYSIEIPLKKQVKVYTGKTETKTEIRIMGKAFPLFLEERPRFESYDAAVSEEPVVLFGVADVPIVKTTLFYREYRLADTAITKEEAKRNAEDAFIGWMNQQTEKIVEYHENGRFDEMKNAYVLNVSVVFEKEIGTEVAVDPLEIPEPLR